MKNVTNRRNFIQKLAAAASGVALAAKTGFASAGHEVEKIEADTVKNIKALGFQWATQDPFLFCVHHEDFFPKGNDRMGPAASLEGRQIGEDFMVKDGWRMYHGKSVPGFPGHPHRGFETVTVVRKGMVDHSDSLGAAGRYGDGDVQWMTAGKGVQHAEMFPLLDKEKDNPLELFQIWLNLPKKNKMTEPHFKMLWAETIPLHKYTDASGKSTRIEVIAGKIGQDQAPAAPPDSWASHVANEIGIWNVFMEAGAHWEMPVCSAGINRSIYFYKGRTLSVNGRDLPFYHSADLDAAKQISLVAGAENCQILVLQGRPIDEPVVQYGPFVMNTRDEIQQAFADYQSTHFGGWPWPVSDPVHPRSKGRFARHADGSIENPS